MMFEPLLFQVACGFAQLDTNGWIGINVLVVLFSVTFGALIYTVANFMPGQKGRKLKGIASYEIIEAIFSVILVFALFVIANFACQAGAVLYGSGNGYAGIFTAAEGYIGNLLFQNGVNLMTSMYTVSINYSMIAKIVYFLMEEGAQFLQGVVSALAGGDIFGLSIGFSTNIASLLGAYAGIYTNIYGTFLIASFAGLFIMFLVLPIIQAAALTIVAPLAIAFRALAFTGPGLRKTANLFLAMAVGFYFVLPLTIGFNSYVVSCLNIQNQLGIQNNACDVAGTTTSQYPFFTRYLANYVVVTPPSSIFENQAGVGIISSGANGAAPSWVGSNPDLGTLDSSFYNSVTNLNSDFALMFSASETAESYGRQVAAYLFVSTVLLAIDFGITLGFIAGLAKGLDAMAGLFGAGSFWSDR